jgi:CheY-like chemotaxis protein
MGVRDKRVLIVEDSPVMRELFKLTFKGKRGIQLDNAGDGVGALQAVRQGSRPYDLILLDLNMPVMDGMKFLTLLNEEPLGEGSVVAIVSTESSPEVEAEARARGAAYFLRKPVTRRQVDEVIFAALGV